jgi:hypothetical protein
MDTAAPIGSSASRSPESTMIYSRHGPNPDHANPDHANPDHANPDHANPDHANPDQANTIRTT